MPYIERSDEEIFNAWDDTIRDRADQEFPYVVFPRTITMGEALEVARRGDSFCRLMFLDSVRSAAKYLDADPIVIVGAFRNEDKMILSRLSVSLNPSFSVTRTAEILEDSYTKALLSELRAATNGFQDRGTIIVTGDEGALYDIADIALAIVHQTGLTMLLQKYDEGIVEICAAPSPESTFMGPDDDAPDEDE